MRIRLVEVLHQRAAESDVEQLGATTHAEHRESSIESGADQAELPFVAAGLDFTELGMRILAVQRGIGIGPACHHETVEAIDHVDGIGIAGQLHRQSADRGDPLRVFAEVQVDLFAVQRTLRQMRYPLDGPAAAGKPDQRSTTHAVLNEMGIRFMPLMKLERSRSIGPFERASLILGSSSSNRTFSSIRAS